jgi:hypothetical protein
MADHRLRLQASQIGTILLELAGILGDKTGDAALKAVVGGAPKVQGTNSNAWLVPCAEDLIANRGRSLVLVGPRQSAAVQALALSIIQRSARSQHIGRPSFAYASGSEYFRPREGARRQDDQDFGDRRWESRLQCTG